MSTLMGHRAATLRQLAVICSLTPPMWTCVRWAGSCFVTARIDVGDESLMVSAPIDDEAKAERAAVALRDPILCGLMAEGAWEP